MTGNNMNQEALIPNPEDRIMCVKVGKVKRENLYEMTRKYWKVDITRARKATHVLALLMVLWKKSIILSIGNTQKTHNTLDGVNFWALKMNIQHTLGKMSQPSMVRARIP